MSYLDINGLRVFWTKIKSWVTNQGYGTYSKPQQGIPKTDLSNSVQTSLSKADSALQAAPVTSVNSKTGAVSLTASDVGLGNVGNFKAVSTQSNQGLTVTEKENARTNIGAGTSSFSGNYTDLSNKPTIPTKVSQLANDSGYTTNTGTITGITMNGDVKGTSGVVNLGVVLTEHQDLSNYAKTSDLTTHTGNTTVHITSTERTNWNAAKTHADSAHAPSNAEVNQNAFSNVKVGNSTIAADSATDTLTLTAGNNVTLTADTSGDGVTIAAKDTVYTHPTTSGNKHIPSGGSSGQILRWSADGTAVWGADNNTTYSNATTSTAGLMSSSDKTKLDGIATGATKITVDSALSSTSTNPVQNKVVNSAISNLNTLVGDTSVTTQINNAIASKADLDTNGKVPSSQLPSYVDDVLEYSAKSNFPSTGESGKIYVDTATNLTYRWSGSAYVEISPSLALGETSSTAYRGDRGKIAYDHSQTSHAPSNAEANQNAFSNVKVGSTTVAADSKTDTLELVAGTNVTLTPDATNDKVTITAKDTTYSAGTGLYLSGNTFNINSGVVPTYGSVLQTTNPFGGRSLYISKIDNAFYCADKRWTVTGSYTGTSSGTYSASQLSSLFNGSYEDYLLIPKGCTAKIRITFNTDNESSAYNGTKVFPGYPYGYVYLSYYHTGTPSVSSKMKMYCNYEPHTIGEHEYSMSSFVGSYPASDASAGNAGLVEVVRQGNYAMSYIEFEIKGATNYNVTLTQIEMKLDRPDSSKTPFLSKYASEKLYSPLTAPQFNGSLNGNAATATALTSSAGSATQPVYFSGGKPTACSYTLGKSVPSDAKFTDTTYTLGSFGITATASELNVLDGITSTVTELNYCDGVTSNIQTQLNGKASSSHNHSAANITAGTLAGSVVANTSAVSALTDKQIRNITISTSEPVNSQGVDGDIWVTYGSAQSNCPFPVGGIYISVSSTSPSSLWSGTTWERIGVGRTLISAGGDDNAVVDENTYTGRGTNIAEKHWFPVGEKGGEINHILTTTEMPAHTHTIDSSGAHHHASQGRMEGSGTGANIFESYNGATKTRSVNVPRTGDNGAHTHSPGSTGGDGAHNNMSTYLAVYMWKRVS